jgi:hypothetical protein
MEVATAEAGEVEEEGRVDGKAEGRPESGEYVETGGLRWSLPLGVVANFSWPFAKIRISPTRIRVAAMADLRFLGAWDQNWISAVEYRRLEDGYELNLTRGFVGAPDLKYPTDSGVASVSEKRTYVETA